MASGQTRTVGGIVPKKSSVAGKVPTGTTIGEIFSNLSDRKLWGYDGMTEFEYGSSSFLALTGGIVTGNTMISGSFSANTIISGSTNLYSIFQPINKSLYNAYILTAGTSYTFTGTVNTLSINKTTGSATQVNLPSNPNVNDFFIVKDRAGDSFSYPITVSGGTKTIDGDVSYKIKVKDKPSLTFLFDGEEYIVI